MTLWIAERSANLIVYSMPTGNGEMNGDALTDVVINVDVSSKA